MVDHIGVNLAKILGRPDWYNPAYCQRPCWSGRGRGLDWVRRRMCLEWNMKNVGHENAEFSQICKWNFKGSI